MGSAAGLSAIAGSLVRGPPHRYDTHSVGGCCHHKTGWKILINVGLSSAMFISHILLVQFAAS